jgi:magnesium transporter
LKSWCCPRVVLILKFWNELRNTEIISTFKTLYYSASGFLLYAIKSQEDKDFKVIEVEIFSYFFLDCIKSLELLTDRLWYGDVKVRLISFFLRSLTRWMRSWNLDYCIGYLYTLNIYCRVYEMNFQHMPELQYQNGYYIVIGLWFNWDYYVLFRKRRWF